MTQGEIIAGAIASSASIETDAIRVNPEELLALQAGQSVGPNTGELDDLDFPINPERVGPVLRRLISPTRTRARIFDREAAILLIRAISIPAGRSCATTSRRPTASASACSTACPKGSSASSPAATYRCRWNSPADREPTIPKS